MRSKSGKTSTISPFSMSTKININCNDISFMLDSFDTCKNSKSIEYLNVPSTFDIETTSFYRNIKNPSDICLKPTERDEKRYEKASCMYAFVFGINGKTVIGRTWDDFESIVNQVVGRYKLSLNRRLIVYVHNLSFEFQYLKDRFDWENVFAIDDRRPIYALARNGIEFRCSYLLTGYSLEKVGEHLNKYKVEKKVGDLDYSKFRHCKTLLSQKELGYIVNDGLVVMAHIQCEIERLGNIVRIPLTKTGYVRKFVRKKCLYSDDNNHRKDKFKFIQYNKMISSIRIQDGNEYKLLKRAFQGGFTHASAWWSGTTKNDVTSFDFTSSYPSVMVCEKYPMGSGKRIQISKMSELKRYFSEYLVIFDIEFTDLAETFKFEHYISSSKCYRLEGYEEDNGRIVKAKRLCMSLTNLDYDIIEATYKWSKIRLANVHIYKKGYLPKDFIMAILEEYQKKTELKGVSGKESEYLVSKENINSCYGMSVTDIVRPIITYENHVWTEETPNLTDELDKYNNDKRRFLAYQWGVFVTAYARRNLWSGIFECQNDYIYSDTDSMKILNAKNHIEYVDRYNEQVNEKMKRVCKYYGIDFKLTRPKTINGVEKALGVWDFDGKYKRFKTLGAKRYMVEYDDGSHSLTVSGVNKKTSVPWLEKKATKENRDIFDLFADGLYIPKKACGKNLHTYIDYPQSGEFVDCNGLMGNYDEMGGVHLEKADYTLGLSSAYCDYLNQIKEVSRK